MYFLQAAFLVFIASTSVATAYGEAPGIYAREAYPDIYAREAYSGIYAREAHPKIQIKVRESTL
jgi:hypothetical protein